MGVEWESARLPSVSEQLSRGRCTIGQLINEWVRWTCWCRCIARRSHPSIRRAVAAAQRGRRIYDFSTLANIIPVAGGAQ